MPYNSRLLAVLLSMLATPALAQEVTLYADQVTGRDPNHWRAEGHVEVHYQNRVLYADRVDYDRNKNEVIAQGHVKLVSPGLSTEAPAARVLVDKNQGIVLHPRYTLPERQAHGQANKAEELGKGHYLLSQADYTSCDGERPVWRIKARSIELNQNTRRATVRGGHLDILKVPVLYLPYLSYPTGPERQSGLLAPSIGTSDINGFTVAAPYYWNIRPNLDATLTPRFFSKRGLQLQSEFRYLGQTSAGTGHFDILPGDKRTGKTLFAGDLVHHKQFTPRVSTDLDLHYVSYRNYLADFGGAGVGNMPYLPSSAYLNYNSDQFSSGVALKGYQDLALNGEAPYQQLPYVFLNGKWPLGLGFFTQVNGNFNYFTRRTGVVGQRLYLEPRVGWRWERPAGYLEPQIGTYLTQYQLQRTAPGQDRNPRRLLPTATLSGGLFFDRAWSPGVTQTFEPHFRYVYIPAKDQSDIPLFDTGLRIPTYPIIFQDNLFAGYDRINAANRITIGLSSSWHANDTGRELLRASIGQIRYFSDRQVDLSGQVVEGPRQSDYFAAARWQPWSDTRLFTDAEYDPYAKRLARFNLGAQYQPRPRHVLDLSYRYTRDFIDQALVSGQWPIGGRWDALASVRYDLQNKQPLEHLLGFGYDGGCWAARLLAYQQIRLGGTRNNAIFFQILLRGLTSLGNQPTATLDQLIPGAQTEF